MAGSLVYKNTNKTVYAKHLLFRNGQVHTWI